MLFETTDFAENHTYITDEKNQNYTWMANNENFQQAETCPLVSRQYHQVNTC